jgi:hypothetical protein
MNDLKIKVGFTHRIAMNFTLVFVCELCRLLSVTWAQAPHPLNDAVKAVEWLTHGFESLRVSRGLQAESWVIN